MDKEWNQYLLCSILLFKYDLVFKINQFSKTFFLECLNTRKGLQKNKEKWISSIYGRFSIRSLDNDAK